MRGLAIPVRAIQGRAAISDGAEENRKIISLMTMAGDSTNPFRRDRGIRIPIFAVDGTAVRALTEHQIKTHFRRLEKGNRAKLDRIQISGSAAGDLRVDVAYVDLETDEELEATSKISRG